MEQTVLDEMARAERLDYFRKWRAANPEKIKRHNATYWQKRAERKVQEQQTAEQEDSRE